MLLLGANGNAVNACTLKGIYSKEEDVGIVNTILGCYA